MSAPIFTRCGATFGLAGGGLVTLDERTAREDVAREARASAPYRYHLWREWEPTRPRIVWVMLNPSTADDQELDPTLQRVLQFSRRHGYGRFDIVNLFALRSSDPKVLERSHMPKAEVVGVKNDEMILGVCNRAVTIVAAWGATTTYYRFNRAIEVKELLLREGHQLSILSLTKDDHPIHPLARGKSRVPDDAPLVLWEQPR